MVPVCEPFLDGNELNYVIDAVKSGWISSAGKYIELFENAMADYCGVKHGIAVSNGTNALHLTLVALGVEKGDEVIIPDFNGIYGAYSICYIGAMPVFVDAEMDTWNIDVAKIEEKITKKTKAIMPVHIYGHPYDMTQIRNLAKEYNIKIIEDAAEAHGAEYYDNENGASVKKKTGSLGDISIFSFFANKVITTGEGGMLLTDNNELADKCRYYRNLCFPLKGMRNFIHNEIGYNYRMSNIHAALGLAQVEKLDYYVDLRRKNNKLYRKYLEDVPGITFQQEKPWAKNVYWMNGIVIDPDKCGIDRSQLIKILQENGIDFRLFFSAMHKQPALFKYGCVCTGDYPVSEYLAHNGLYLPSSSNLKEENILLISNVIRSAVGV